MSNTTYYTAEDFLEVHNKNNDLPEAFTERLAEVGGVFLTPKDPEGTFPETVWSFGLSFTDPDD